MNSRLISSCSLAAALSVSALSPLSAAIQDATPVAQVAPAYSHELRARGVEGEVVVSFTVSATGNVIDPKVVSSTDRALEYPTLAAVRKWKFAPAMKDGVAVSEKVVQPVSFVMPDFHSASERLVTLKPHSSSQPKDGTSTY
jgi:TonB family protein